MSYLNKSIMAKFKDDLIPELSSRIVTAMMCFVLFANFAFAQSFTPSATTLPNVRDGASAWGDYDNDGDLDLLITGIQDNQLAVSRIFRNDSTAGFTDINATLAPVFFSAVAWGDYDNDGWLDILLTGRGANADPLSKIYRNNGDGTFADINAPLIPVQKSSVDWADFDNDGDLDILLAGATSSSADIAVIYDNDTLEFELFDAGLPGISEGTAAWADYDNDGDHDILLTGSGIAKVFRNDGALSFADISASLQGVVASASAWADYDNDGDQDILITGSYFADVYTNAGSNVFNALGLPVSKGVARSSVAWGDYDNDGDLDFSISGDNNTLNRVASLCRNDGGTFTDLNAGLTGLWYSNSACGDFNNDGKLDLLVSGEDSLFHAATILYENADTNVNAIPATPGNLNATELPHLAILSWDQATDTETADSALTYNIFVGRAANLNEFVSAMSEIPSGYRRVVSGGEQGNNRVWSVNDLPKDKYYWAVQSVDNNFSGSPFAAIDSFEICKNTNVSLGPDTTLCDGVVYTLDGGLGLTNYNWSTGETTQTIDVTVPGTYHVTVTSADGCHAIDTVVIDYYPPMSVDAGEDVTINLNYSAQLHATGGVVYEWAPSESLDNALIHDPVASPTQTTFYNVTVTDANNCSATDSVLVTVILEPVIKVTNFLSPNGDHILDVLVIDGIRSYPGNTMIIFNRWGDIVYEATDYQDDWGGQVKNTSLNLWGEEVPEGVYFYKVLLNNGKPPVTGNITVKK